MRERERKSLQNRCELLQTKELFQRLCCRAEGEKECDDDDDIKDKKAHNASNFQRKAFFILSKAASSGCPN